MKDSLKKVDAILKDQEKKKKEALPFLNSQAIAIRKIDDHITYYENKIKQLEESKQKELEKMNELFDAAVISYHIVGNYKISSSLSRKMNIKDVPAFLLWLKKNCEPKEVLEFFTDAIKSTHLKRFVEKQADKQREKGIMNPTVDGIDLGDITYRRLTTQYMEEKKK